MREPTVAVGRLPPVVRLYNGARRAAERVGLSPAGFDDWQLMARARRRAGMHDFGARDFRAPLRRLCVAFEREAELSPWGRAMMRGYLIGALEKRLRLVHWLGRAPEIREQRIERPLFIVGLPRTGSTFLHQLIGADPELRTPLFWQLLWPTPPPRIEERSTDARIARARRKIEQGKHSIPELSVLHAHDASAPEECQFLMDPSLMNPLVPAGEPFERWFRRQDLRPAYQFYADQLRLLSWRWPGQPWVLKAPFHLWHLDALVDVFPDARFVVTHRDPRAVIPSACSYAAARSRTFYDRLDLAQLGASVLESLSELTRAGLRHRAAMDPSRFVDVSYSELVSAPLAVVERVFDHFGYPRSQVSHTARARFIADNPQHRHGVHHYSAEQFQLAPEQIDASFAGYEQFCRERGIALRRRA